MKKILSALVILFSPVLAFAQGVTSTGVGTVYAKPDCAHLSFSITTSHAKAKNANADNKTTSDGFFALLKKHKIDEKDISTQHFNISPVHEETKPGHHKLVGYSVSHQISVRVRDMKLAGVIIDEAVDGNVHLGSINFMVSDRSKLEDKARNLALSDAKKRANQMVSRLGSKLGALRTVSESSYYPQSSPYAPGRAQSADSATTIATGQMAIVVRVTANWDIVEANPFQLGMTGPILGGKAPAHLSEKDAKDYFDKLKAGGFKAYPDSTKGKLEFPKQTDWLKANCLGYVMNKNEWMEPGAMGNQKANQAGHPGWFDKEFKGMGLELLMVVPRHKQPFEPKLKPGHDVMIAMYGYYGDLLDAGPNKGKNVFIFTHFATKRKGDTLWSSKLGEKILVQHEFLSQLECAEHDYGTVVAIYGTPLKK